MQLAMYLRDCRGGSGNRNGFRKIINWISLNHSQWITSNLNLIPEVGRWDDLEALIGTPCEEAAIKFWATAILSKDGLANKWCPRENKNKVIYHKLRKAAFMSPPEFRKHLAKNTNVVETDMCNGSWSNIKYNHVPSVAMARLSNAFERNDRIRFTSWAASLADKKSGNSVNASVLFPHDCIRTLRAELSKKNGYFTWSRKPSKDNEEYDESLLANAQFEALPDYINNKKNRIIPICDFSGSMQRPISVNNSIELIDISMGLGLYCSDRLGKDNPFYRKFIPFSDDARLISWENDSFSVAVQKYNDGFCGGTNINAALDQILNSAIMFNVSNDQMPTCLLIISDMQWDGGGVSEEQTAVEVGLSKWEEKGYSRPKIVYWNLNRYDSSPSTVEHKDVALVSGYSPACLSAILEGEDFSPIGVMNRAISKYKVIHP
jgi:hypothetical protein